MNQEIQIFESEVTRSFERNAIMVMGKDLLKDPWAGSRSNSIYFKLEQVTQSRRRLITASYIEFFQNTMDMILHGRNFYT